MTESFQGRSTGKFYSIEKEIGSGGQGQVYLVHDPVTRIRYAAKWYKPGARSVEQYQQIENLVHRGVPPTEDPGIHFIWPLECLSFEPSSGFGYLMPLIDTGKFFTLNQICNGKIKQPKLPVLCRISQRIAAALDTFHSAGLAYCDINMGNVMLDPVGGEIVIYDNDNVVINRSTTPVRGVWEFMAPEVALGQSQPNAETDIYSVAILLYYLWMWEHPMDGKETLKLYSWDIPAKKKYFAENPVFVFHPTNTSNTAHGVPELKLHTERWNRMCPPRLKRMFTETFVEGVHDPARRKQLNDWQRLFFELEANAPICTCGAINIWDGETTPLLCWKCNKEIHLGLSLRVRQAHCGDSILLASPGASLRRHHLNVARFDGSSTNAVGIIEPHPKEAGHCIIRNVSDQTWSYVAPAGQLLDIAPKQARALMPGVELTINQRKITVQLA